ncbi:hypothetical protein [Pseudomonas sp. EL_65y_Pfl2_R95]|uniref:hypothetical protein n=1 Tax=Pseudomonas sp. EL_65y_Pfl2_R95 TaxID=3088698 RepID=UPI0030D71A7C
MPTQIKNKIALTLLLICTTLAANSQENQSVKKAEQPKSETAQKTENSSLETYHLIQEILNDKLSENNKTSKALEQQIKEQEERITSLESKLSKGPPPDQGFTATLVLASVTVIITVLGVLIATLSIFGYTNIKKEATKASQETAQDTINKIAEQGLQDATEKSIIVLIENGRFDEIIQSSISSIAYRGINIDDEFIDEEGKA